ncbi:Trigalactosyldiacylglycerol 1 isoform 3 [Gossypium australe]|uniref:Trigalactosyldiacylglycerol 1 isoform 3 n=1 Tax=Gossypium australe TaxID=47621 RepID=A0A5B6WWN8_9ROSI|nr:Trigalactosyldiacylglycerol 1 isoform 3 [Gossypium australe]
MEENKEGSTKLKAQDETRNRPSIFVIGCPNVGKRTLISRLASVEFEEEDSSQVVVHGWTINTKYYTADVSLCMAHLQDGFSAQTLPIFNHSTALVMVFDMSHLSTFSALQDWISYTDIKNLEILICIGNKVDRVPGHPVHAEYAKRIHKLDDSSTHPSSDFTRYGISEAEGSSLLKNEDPSSDIRRKCLEWCIDHNIEFIEACALNADFDKCLSVDGDLQGVERLYGAISAHMWPGMVLKSGDMITEPSLPEKEDSSEEEPDYQFEYEVLSAGSAEPGDDIFEEWISASPANTFLDIGKSVDAGNSDSDCVQGNITRCEKEESHTFPSGSALGEKIDRMEPNAEEPGRASASEVDDGPHYEFEDLEQLMSEVGNIRSNLRLMPDFQRREMAAKLAIKMAAMFGGDSDDEEEI